MTAAPSECTTYSIASSARHAFAPSVASRLATGVLALAAAAMFAACGSAVDPASDAQASDAGFDVIFNDVASGDGSLADAGPVPFCRFADGRHCAIGASCPAGDGCNSCVCRGDGTPSLICTLLDCALEDAGTRACRAEADCNVTAGETCIFGIGCSATATPGHCAPSDPCDEPLTFCACDGSNYSSCFPTRPTRSTGVCEGPVADAAVSCEEGAFIGRGGQCTGPDDRALPASCCSGFDCIAAHALCNSPPPVCPAGQVASVHDGCWGPCVPIDRCDAIPCDPSHPGDCPAPYGCDPTAHVCRAPR